MGINHLLVLLDSPLSSLLLTQKFIKVKEGASNKIIITKIKEGGHKKKCDTLSKALLKESEAWSVGHGVTHANVRLLNLHISMFPSLFFFLIRYSAYWRLII